MKLRSPTTAFILGVCTLLSVFSVTAIKSAAQGEGKKSKGDWKAYFGAGITPPYPFSGVLKVTMSKDDHFSYTDKDVKTSSFHCSTGQNSVDCAEGSGLYYDLILPDGRSIYVGRSQWLDEDPLSWLSSGGDALFDVPREAVEAGHIFHFRWKDTALANRLLCVQEPGTETIPDGKPRKEYARHHRMESCYFAVSNTTN
jgi:hypothetical protein